MCLACSNRLPSTYVLPVAKGLITLFIRLINVPSFYLKTLFRKLSCVRRVYELMNFGLLSLITWRGACLELIILITIVTWSEEYTNVDGKTFSIWVHVMTMSINYFDSDCFSTINEGTFLQESLKKSDIVPCYSLWSSLSMNKWQYASVSIMIRIRSRFTFIILEFLFSHTNIKRKPK